MLLVIKDLAFITIQTGFKSPHCLFLVGHLRANHLTGSILGTCIIILVTIVGEVIVKHHWFCEE